ncbi:hypothetical protein GCM10010967_44320 [Dyadobacter beijingensis]|uniref:HTH-type transcriptional regulator / antitoxin HigA n=1 Tax=Dyadobacter beijingensis TaxID=365489 RepID=A0ABQ2IC58_9BACT|nr:hypothetical protein [Dyadobacter beijingensis]GGN04496.1 hypothetical protein GCM10010967_44320 [Dyadobacter beijingensis]
MDSLTTEKGYEAALHELHNLVSYIDNAIPDCETNHAEELVTAILAYEEIYYPTTRQIGSRNVLFP